MSDPLDDPVERLLREDAGRPLPEDGFARRLLRALPPATAVRWWLEPAFVLGSAAVGSALAWALVPAGTSLLQGFLDLARLHSNTPSAFAALGVVLAMAVTAAVLVADEG
jgi:hypothetical protein